MEQKKNAAVAGIDIGGTNTAIGIIDRSGSCLADAAIPTKADQPAQSFVDRLRVSIDSLIQRTDATHTLAGIGIGAPNANYYKGTVEFPPNLRWEGITPLAQLVRNFYDLPVAVTNDANAAAIGEMKFGAAKGMKHFVVITLGTGLGSGIVVNGDILYGADGFAGELGHVAVKHEGRLCGCGKFGCLETYVSAGGLCRTVFELLAEKKEPSELRDLSFNQMTSKHIAEAAQRGDGIAKESFEATGKILGRKLADTIAHLSPEAIILFGGMAGAGAVLFEPTERWMNESCLKIFQNKVKLLPSSLKEGNAAVLGAAALIWNELDKTEK